MGHVRPVDSLVAHHVWKQIRANAGIPSNLQSLCGGEFSALKSVFYSTSVVENSKFETGNALPYSGSND